jgi:hypothetical protein
MANEKRSTTIHKINIGLKMSLDEVEEAISAACREAMMAVRGKVEKTELARIDIMKNETVVFFRGDRIVADGVKTILKNKSPDAKIKIIKTTAAALEKVP